MTGEKPGEVASARRRLIRGTFAAPAVVALHSGSAFAATSSALRCLTNGTTVQPTPVSNSTDTFIRVQLYSKSNDNKWYINGWDVYGVAASSGGAGVNTSFISSSSVWREVILGANGTVQLGATQDSKPGGTDLGQKYVALRFAAGDTNLSPVQIVGVLDGTSNLGSAISFNCWRSIAG